MIKAGEGRWNMTNSKLTSLLSQLRSAPSKSVDANYTVPQTSVKVAANYSWTDSGTLEITARFVEESLGPQTIECKFSEIKSSVGVTIGPKATSSPAGLTGRSQPAVLLRGMLVKVE